MTRKTPTLHRVKSHTRNGKTVVPYVRGSGHRNPLKISNPSVLKPKGYTVILTYSDKKGDKETVKVIATSYQRAIDEAFEEKVDKREPIEITVIDPSIGEIMSWAGKRAVALGKGAGSRVLDFGRDVVEASLETTAKTKPGFMGAMAKKSLAHRHDRNVERLVKQSYSKDRATKAIARAKLKREHSDVWDVMDISRS